MTCPELQSNSVRAGNTTQVAHPSLNSLTIQSRCLSRSKGGKKTPLLPRRKPDPAYQLGSNCLTTDDELLTNGEHLQTYSAGQRFSIGKPQLRILQTVSPSMQCTTFGPHYRWEKKNPKKPKSNCTDISLVFPDFMSQTENKIHPLEPAAELQWMFLTVTKIWPGS